MSTEQEVQDEKPLSTLDLDKGVKEATVPVDPETERRGGTKEEATNSDAIAIEKAKVEASPVEEDAKPSFFIRKSDRHRVEVDVLTSKRDGKVMSISRAGIGLDFDKDFAYLRHTSVWFEFSLPNYEDMTSYRQRSAVYRREAQQMIVDKLSLRNFILVWHLKDWSLTDDTGIKVSLMFDDSGALSDRALAQVYAVMPTMVDVILTILEKDVLLS
jgi:hypothetical protein